jgi:hypothetical protein
MKPTIIEVFSKKRLGQRSFTKYIKYICPDCKRTRSVPLNAAAIALIKTRSNLCYKCAARKRAELHYDRVNNVFKEKMNTKKNFDVNFIFNLLENSWASPRQSGYYFNKGKRKFLSKKEQLEIFPSLGFTVIPKSTEEFRLGVLNFIKQQNNQYILSILNLKIEKYLHLLSKNSLRVNTSRTEYIELLKILDFKFKVKKTYIIINYGSFFINNKWIHIG